MILEQDLFICVHEEFKCVLKKNMMIKFMINKCRRNQQVSVKQAPKFKEPFMFGLTRYGIAV